MYSKLDQFASLLFSDDPEIKKMIKCLSGNDMYMLEYNYKNTLLPNYRNQDIMSEVKSKSYTLRNEQGHWLGQVVITSDGLFSSVTDWGNFSYAWRSTGEQDFRSFFTKMDTHYFAGKMYAGIAYVCYGKKYEKACQNFAEKILPVFQKALAEDLEKNPIF